MRQKRLRFAGAVFILAGLAVIVEALVDKRTPLMAIGGAFIAIGAAMLARSKKSASA